MRFLILFLTLFNISNLYAQITYGQILSMGIASNDPDSVLMRLHNIESQIKDSNDSAKFAYYLHAGHAYLIKKDYEKAIKYNEAARSFAENVNLIDGDYTTVLHKLIYAYFYINNYKSACEVAEWAITRCGYALEKNRLSSDIYWMLGMTLGRLGEYDYIPDVQMKGFQLAQKFFTKNDPQYYYNLVHLYNTYVHYINDSDKAAETANIILGYLNKAKPRSEKEGKYFSKIRTLLSTEN